MGGALMFGYAALAQSSFAALGNTAFSGVVTEAITLDDSSTGVRGATGNITESMSVLTDSSVAFIDFKATASESITLADSSSKIYGATANITENASFADSQNVIKAMFDTVVEPITMLDFASYIGWFIINDNQTITWNAANNSQSVTWQNIGDDQTPNWVVINNTQA
jgi:hypothetical protein